MFDLQLQQIAYLPNFWEVLDELDTSLSHYVKAQTHQTESLDNLESQFSEAEPMSGINVGEKTKLLS